MRPDRPELGPCHHVIPAIEEDWSTSKTIRFGKDFWQLVYQYRVRDNGQIRR